MRTPRDQTYLAFVRSQPCCVTGSEFEVVAHHVRMKPHGGGVGLKPSDYRTVPLQTMRHLELHSMSDRVFWQKHGVDPNLVMARLLRQYLAVRYLLVVEHEIAPEMALDFIEQAESLILKGPW